MRLKFSFPDLQSESGGGTAEGIGGDDGVIDKDAAGEIATGMQGGPLTWQETLDFKIVATQQGPPLGLQAE